MNKTHTYRGYTITPCDYAKGEHDGRWVVITYHRTGNPYSDELNPHFHTLTDAKAGINERIAYAAS